MGDDLTGVRLRVHGETVAEYVVEPDIDPRWSPRPYLHPVRTLAGVPVTDTLPAGLTYAGTPSPDWDCFTGSSTRSSGGWRGWKRATDGPCGGPCATVSSPLRCFG